MKRCCIGFSLTELLVATTLLAIATAGGLAALSRSQAARGDAGTLQQLHERAQYAFATLESELQMAGYFGAAPAPALGAAEVPVEAQRCGAGIVTRLDLPVQVESQWNLPCEARGGGAQPQSHVLIVRRVSARLAASPQAGRAQWLSRSFPSPGGALYWQGDAPWTAAASAHGEELRELLLRIFYVARDADGDASMPALRMKSLTSIAGVPAFIDTEVMNGIEDLQVELLPSASAPQAARVRLRVRAEAPAMQRGVARTLEITRHFTLRNAAR